MWGFIPDSCDASGGGNAMQLRRGAGLTTNPGAIFMP